MTNQVGPESEPDAELEVRAIAAERLTFFADAVIAIAITLLALDLPLPAGATNGAILHALVVYRDEYLAFVISFMVIAAHWRSHHRIFRYVTHLDGRLTGLTMAWLFAQVIMPFATRLLTGDGAFQARFGFYAVVQLASFATFALMVYEIQRKHLYRDDTPPTLFSHSYVRLLGIGAGFGLSIPVSLFTHYSYVCWFVAPWLTSVTWRWLLGNRPPEITV
jgi:TMEM175 potassium channel family protein